MSNTNKDIQIVKVDNLLGLSILSNFLGTLLGILPWVVIIGLLFYFIILPALENSLNNSKSSSVSSSN